MQITFKAYAALEDYLPADRRKGNQMALEVSEGSTITQVIAPLHLPPHQVHLVLVNGYFIPPEQRPTHALREGDVLAVWPPIAGG